MGTKMDDPAGVDVAGGIGTKLDRSNVTTPTAAELIAAYGTAASHGLRAGEAKIFVQDDNGADTTVKLIVTNGTSYFFSASLTKAA